MKTLLLTFYCCCLAALLMAQPGLKAEYFNGINFDEKVATRTDAKIDKSWNDTPPVPGIDPHFCSIRWTGMLTAPKTGTYTFSARVDDGIRVWVGGVQVIDAWELNDDGQFTGRVQMKEGVQYELRVEYFNALIEGQVSLIWQMPDAEEPKVIESKYYEQTVRKPTSPDTKPSAKPTAPKPKHQAPQEQHTAPKPQYRTPPIPPELPKDTLESYKPRNVQFEQGKAVMLPNSEGELNRLAGFMLRHPELHLRVEGHTDIIGDTNMNQELSQQRAEVVKQYLEGRNVPPDRMEAKGFGSSRPLVTGNSKKGYPENRRVVFVFK